MSAMFTSYSRPWLQVAVKLFDPTHPTARLPLQASLASESSLACASFATYQGARFTRYKGVIRCQGSAKGFCWCYGKN